jgi:glutamate N-acetyltransferase/amino-acid N-acetyltransferase
MAIGKAGEPIEVERVAIRVGGHAIADGGHRLMNYDEAPVVAHIKGQEVLLEVTVGAGPGSATVWTCDLTHGYISINADYRS